MDPQQNNLNYGTQQPSGNYPQQNVQNQNAANVNQNGWYGQQPTQSNVPSPKKNSNLLLYLLFGGAIIFLMMGAGMYFYGLDNELNIGVESETFEQINLDKAFAGKNIEEMTEDEVIDVVVFEIEKNEIFMKELNKTIIEGLKDLQKEGLTESQSVQLMQSTFELADANPELTSEESATVAFSDFISVETKIKENHVLPSNYVKNFKLESLEQGAFYDLEKSMEHESNESQEEFKEMMQISINDNYSVAMEEFLITSCTLGMPNILNLEIDPFVHDGFYDFKTSYLVYDSEGVIVLSNNSEKDYSGVIFEENPNFTDHITIPKSFNSGKYLVEYYLTDLLVNNGTDIMKYSRPLNCMQRTLLINVKSGDEMIQESNELFIDKKLSFELDLKKDSAMPDAVEVLFMLINFNNLSLDNADENNIDSFLTQNYTVPLNINQQNLLYGEFDIIIPELFDKTFLSNMQIFMRLPDSNEIVEFNEVVVIS